MAAPIRSLRLLRAPCAPIGDLRIVCRWLGFFFPIFRCCCVGFMKSLPRSRNRSLESGARPAQLCILHSLSDACLLCECEGWLFVCTDRPAAKYTFFPLFAPPFALDRFLSGPHNLPYPPPEHGSRCFWAGGAGQFRTAPPQKSQPCLYLLFTQTSELIRSGSGRHAVCPPAPQIKRKICGRQAGEVCGHPTPLGGRDRPSAARCVFFSHKRSPRPRPSWQLLPG
jgi:hypothetical protein